MERREGCSLILISGVHLLRSNVPDFSINEEFILMEIHNACKIKLDGT